MKYLIEVPDETGQAYYNIEPYTEPDQKAIDLQHAHDIENVARMNYSKGAEDAWELARRIICPSDCCEDSISKYTEKFLGIPSYKARAIFKDLSYQEVKVKYDEWKRKKEEIRVGDEVIIKSDGVKGVVLDEDLCGEFSVFTENGCCEAYRKIHFEKTGRHFPEVAELLKKMREEK